MLGAGEVAVLPRRRAYLRLLPGVELRRRRQEDDAGGRLLPAAVSLDALPRSAGEARQLLRVQQPDASARIARSEKSIGGNASRYTLKRLDSRAYEKRSKKNKEVELVPSRKVYLARHTLSPDTRLFFFNSRDQWIRDALLAHNFAQIADSAQVRFADFVYVVSDAGFNYRALPPGCLFNHFENHQALSSKRLLSFALQAAGAAFYPRTFVMGQERNIDKLCALSLRQLVFRALAQHVSYFKSVAGPRMRVFKRGIRRALARALPPTKLRLHSNWPTARFPRLTVADDPGFRVNRVHVELLLNYLATLKRSLIDLSDRSSCANSFALHPDTIARLELYAAHDLSRSDATEAELCAIGYSAEFWKTPSDYLLYELYAHFLFFKARGLLGDGGLLWIAKPGDKSRGAGIKLFADLAAVRAETLRSPHCLVQQYVARPLLLGGQVKFDVRVWVLLLSVAPLRLFYFPEFYLRLCASRYDLGDLARLSGHLTNYALNKGAFVSAEESVRPSSFLWELLRKRDPRLPQRVLGQMVAAMREAFHATAPAVKHRTRSFQVFGCDMILDTDFKVWLLEVNQSPNCDLRAPFLREATAQMAQSLLCLLGLSTKKPAISWEEIAVAEAEAGTDLGLGFGLVIAGQSTDLKAEAAMEGFLRRQCALKVLRPFLCNVLQRFRQKRRLSSTGGEIIRV